MVDRNKLYEHISAIQKAIRWCEVNDARYFAQQQIIMGMPHAVWGQLRIIAAEDIGLADPTMVGYIEDCFNEYDKLMKHYGTTDKEVKDAPKLCAIIDQAVIAEAIAYKSRLLPMMTFKTLFDIHEQEKFRKSRYDYFGLFAKASEKKDERSALYYAVLVDKFFRDRKTLLKTIRDKGSMRNGDLINSWSNAYEKHQNLLTLTGSVALLIRDLDFTHGEYKETIYNHLSIPSEKATIPDRALDMHTKAGKIKGRGLDYFFKVSGTVKNERFPNDWEEIGKEAYFAADRKGLADEKVLIAAIKKKFNAPPEFLPI